MGKNSRAALPHKGVRLPQVIKVSQSLTREFIRPPHDRKKARLKTGGRDCKRREGGVTLAPLPKRGGL